jgi:EAL domain-containing protein (putative c-di-GMP-specific phosphodiesterase class I)
LSPQHGRDPSILLKRADMAMYDAKSSGMGVHFYQPRVDTNSARRLSMVSELRSAIHEGHIEVYVQPQAEAATGQIRSVEALARWNHPALGMVSPEEFVPVAERSGLIRPLTSYVLRTALLAAAQWRRHGEQLGVAVNLSARSLLDPDLVSEVEHMLRLNGFPAQLLTLEITEGSLMSDTPRAVSQLDRLHDLGVRLSIDDFGTGYSALSYLKRLPVDEVKIDRSFIANLAFDDSDAAIVRSVVDLGTNLSLHVVAEGVEDQHTWERLVDMGCELAQGYYLGRPMPIDDFPTWLAAYRAEQPNPRGVISAIG